MTDDKLKIDWDDLNKPEVDQALAEERRRRESANVLPQNSPFAATSSADAGGARKEYGRVSGAPGAAPAGHAAPSSGGLLYSSLLYTTLAGILLAFVGWGITESTLYSLDRVQVGALTLAALFFAIVGGMLGFGLASVEHFVSGRIAKAFGAGAIGLALGFFGGGVAGLCGQGIYGAATSKEQTVALVLDVSGSMEGEPLNELIASASEFVQTGCKKGIAFSIVTFGDEANLLSSVSRDPALLQEEIAGLEIDGFTNMAAGLDRGSKTLAEAVGARSIVLFTDGQPAMEPDTPIEELVAEELEKYTPEELNRMEEAEIEKVLEPVRQRFQALASEKPTAEALAKGREILDAGIDIWAVGTGEADEQFLRNLTDDTEKVFYAKDDIAAAFRDVEQVLFQGQSGSDDVPLSFAAIGSRALSWAFVGLLLGLAQGLAAGSGRKALNGLIGGALGGCLGGALFDPINALLATSGGAEALSRLLALCAIGALTGALIGIVENILKDAWLEVVSGPLTGKQFIIYRNPTVFGGSPKADIYLFKDDAVEPRHAAIHTTPQGYILEDLQSRSGTRVNGMPIDQHRLRPNDSIQIGQYVFAYSEKARQQTPAGAPAT